ncbi:hypothetical protein RI054_06g35070 [Pseudoscourfieldia marina]
MVTHDSDDAISAGDGPPAENLQMEAAAASLSRNFDSRLAVADDEAEEFMDKVDEVSRLIAGLQDGTLSPEYIDRKMGTQEKEEQIKKQKKHEEEEKKKEPLSDERMEECRRKAADLKREYERRVKAREKFTKYRENVPENHRTKSTDYDAWDMWEPSDDENDPWMLPGASNAQFAAMEKDLNERHKRQTEQRQVAERQRVAGNNLFRCGQFSEAYRCYEAGLDADRRNLHLHANAAQASLKLGCYVQAIEHCDKCMSIREFLHNNSGDTATVAAKALQRRAAARGALGHWSQAVSDLEEAIKLNKDSPETAAQLKRARASLEVERRAKAAAKRLAKGEEGGEGGASLATLRRVEKLAKVLHPPIAAAVPSPSEGGGEAASPPPPPPAVEDPARRPAALAEACGELRTLAEMEGAEGEDVRAHAKACGALDAAARIARGEDAPPPPPAAPVAPSAPMRLLCALCRSDACQDVIATDAYLGAKCADAIASSDVESAAAGAQLLYMLTGTASARKALTPPLTDPERGMAAKLIERCARADEAPSAAASAAGLLGNLCLDAALRAPLRSLPLKPVAALLSHREALLATRAGACIGNACSDLTLRESLVKLGVAEELAAALPASMPAASNDAESRRYAALLTALANILLDDGARKSLLASPAGKNLAVERPMSLLASDATTVRARAAMVLSRLCRDAEGRGAVYAADGIPQVSAALRKSLAEQATSSASDDSSADGGDEDGVLSGAKSATPRHVVEGCARTLALIATSAAVPEIPRGELRARFLADGKTCALAALLDAAAAKNSTDACAGNASLAWGEFARDADALSSLASLGPVAPLIECVKLREGAPARNAGIALSRLAGDAQMLEKLRELRGMEIIGSKVRA